MSKKMEIMMREAGLNPALPHLIFRKSEGVVFASKRMCILLSSFDKKLSGLSEKKMAALWPFSNQEDAGPKIFLKLLKEAPTKIEAQFALQNYTLISTELGDKTVVVVAQLQRKGDLLKDKTSRQELFRTLAHEIRTTAMALDGYVEMLKDLDGAQDRGAAKQRVEVLARLNEISKRLTKNVALLDSLRGQLVDDDDKEAA